MAVEVLEEGVDLGEVGKEVAVGSEPALLDDSVAALAGFQNPEFVLLGDAAGGLCELAETLDFGVLSFFKCALVIYQNSFNFFAT